MHVGLYRAVRWVNGVISDLGALDATSRSFARGVNELGQVVGLSDTATNPQYNAGHAFLWENGVMIDLNKAVTNLPADVDLQSADAINDAGWIVGNT